MCVCVCVCVQYINVVKFTISSSGERPLLRQLQLLEGRGGRKVRVRDSVAPYWKELAIALGFDGPRIEVIDQKSHRNPEEACREVFIRWLDGDYDLKPVTWDSLIRCLIHAGLVDVADLLKEIVRP